MTTGNPIELPPRLRQTPPILPRAERGFRISRSQVRRTPGVERPGFAGELRRQREAAKLSQMKLGTAAGVNQSHISRLESGQREPTRDTVLAIADALDADDIARDRLLTSAGFLPRDLANLFDDAPALQSIVALLASDLPSDARDFTLAALASAADSARRFVAAVERRETA